MINLSLLLLIILVFAKIDILSFGGGYVAIPIVEKEIVEVQKWMTWEEFSNLLAIDELTPGPVAINSATFVGTKMAGILGGFAATLGNVIPSFIISVILINIYLKYHGVKSLDGIIGGLKGMVLGLLLSTALTLLMNAVVPAMSFDIIACVLFGAGLFVLRKFKPDPIIVILGCGVLGFFAYLLIK